MSEKYLMGAEAILMRHLDQRSISNEITISAKVSPTLLAGRVHFDCLLNRQGMLSSGVAFSGIFNEGRQDPSIGYVDGDYFENATFQSAKISLTEVGLDVPLFRVLGELVPAGGSFLVSYAPVSDESKALKQTEEALGRGYPPVATPIGYLLFLAGCGVRFKDHHSTHGRGRNASKLQGFKPVDAEDGKRKGLSLIRELHQFMGTESVDDELARACRTRVFATIERIHVTGA